MENPDLGHVRYLYDHSGCDRDQCCFPDAAARVRCDACRCTVGVEYLCFIAGCDNTGLWLFSGPFWNQARLSLWVGCLCDWIIPVRTRSFVGVVDRGPRPAGVWRRRGAAAGTRATISSVPA